MTTTAPTVIITGANGLVGGQLARYFSQSGWHVTAFVRQPEAQKPLPDVDYVAYDMSSGHINEATFDGADYLVHTAYIKQDRAHPDALRLNLDAAAQLLNLSRKYGIKRNIFMSSMSSQKDAVATYGQQKYRIEQMFNRPEDTIIRSGLVIGNGGLVKQLVSFMRSKHVAPLIDGGDQPLQVIGVYDLARVIEKIFTHNVSGLLTIGSPEVYSYREFYLALRQAFHLPVVFLPVPFFVPLYAIRLINLLHLPLGLTEDNLWGLKHLRAFETLPDLKKLAIELDPLDTILQKTILK